MMEDATSDGQVSPKLDPLKPESVIYAKYGIHLEGRAFDRAKYGGVTRAVIIPTVGWEGEFLNGVSVGIKTSGGSLTTLKGVFKEDVAVHFTLGQESKGTFTSPYLCSRQVEINVDCEKRSEMHHH